MAGGMSAIIPAKRRKRSVLNLPTKPAIGTLGVGPKRAISTSPQKNIPAKIIPLKTHISLRVILLKIPLTPPPPESSLTFFTFLAGTAVSGACGAGAGSFGCDIFSILLTLRLHSVQNEEEHYAAYWYEYEGYEVHEGENVHSSQVSSDRGHDREHDDEH